MASETSLGDLSRIAWPITDREVTLILEFPTDWQLREHPETVATLQRATEVLAGALGTLAAKDAAYGGAWREQGWRGNLARILSKTARLRAMLWRTSPKDSVGEPVADTLQDLINLCVFMTLNRQGDNEWGLRPSGE